MGGGRYRVGPSGCGHDRMVLVSPAGNGRRARCLVCGTLDPVRDTSEEARRALEAMTRAED